MIITNATIDDASFIAESVLTAMWGDTFRTIDDAARIESVITDICRLESSLYSYRNTRVAWNGKERMGCLVSYDGGRYAQWLAEAGRYFGGNSRIGGSDLETGPGEYYLDSMAIGPKYRGQGLGLELMRDSIEKGVEKGFGTFTCLVDMEHTRLMSYYECLGFSPIGRLKAFGVDFLKFKLEIHN